MLANLKAEVINSPLGSLGATCAAIALVSDLGGRGLGDLGANSVYADFAIASLKSVATVFLFAHVPAKLYSHRIASALILYALGLIISSLFCAYYYSYIKKLYFKSHYGGKQDLFILVGFILGAFSISVFIDSAEIKWTSLMKFSGVCFWAAIGGTVSFGFIAMSPFSGIW